MKNQRFTREQKRQQTRERLLDAATEVFSQRGFHAASVDEVAETAGFSKGAVYSNFDNKEDLFLALFERRFEQEVQGWGSIGSHITSSPESVPSDDLGFVNSVLRDRVWNLLLCEFFLYAMRHEEARQKFSVRLSDLRATMKTQLEAQFAVRKMTPSLPIPYLPWLVFALGLGLTWQTYLDPKAVPPDLYTLAITQLLAGQIEA